MFANENDAGQRLDHFLQKKFRKIPKARVYRAIRKGEVRVNGSRSKPETRLVVGDEVRIPPPFLLVPKGSLIGKVNDCRHWDLNSAILFENDEMLCLNKPAGMAVHAGSGISMGVIEAVRDQRQGYYELAHRLDRGTSGCLLLAKKASVLKVLSSLFHDRKVKKQYLALLTGVLKDKHQTIDLPLKKIHSKLGEHKAVVDHELGKPAKTKLTVVQSNDQTTLVQLNPATGRMHQLRAHCACIGHPIVGDSKYGEKKNDSSRLYLHAYKLVFEMNGLSFAFTAPCEFISG